MVGLYAFYVVIVVTWHWYLVRRRREYERDVAFLLFPGWGLISSF
jgi:sodium/potassium/calcium exchanger 6